MSDEEGGRPGGGADRPVPAEERREVRSETEGPASGEPESTAPAEEAGSPEQGRRKRSRDGQGSFWRELPVLIGVALVLALVIKTFVVQAFYIPSASMENTLRVGDRVLVNKLVYHLRDIERGDIVVFSGLDSWDPAPAETGSSNPVMRGLRAVGTAFGLVAGEKDYIKRVIGLPGDHVVCCEAATGRVTVNGIPLDETSYLYADPETGEQDVPSALKFDVVVPPGRLWVMGDHREVSWDSRGHQADSGSGTIPLESVVGRAFVVIWPVSHWRVLEIPATFRQPGLGGAALGAVPVVLGLAGAAPVFWLRRRQRP
ncbi:signal peptidase I [Actinocorallia populi]|uniref:signal peptidase I n=1 Tax=Actinocorallia populi TaxID=2079200 RepID=UPI000D09660B|nr:signal peptidase I [Actinocorallia populi]